MKDDDLLVAEVLGNASFGLDERQRRLLAAVGAKRMGRGGIAAVSRETGISRDTIRRGIGELEKPLPAGRVRSPGGGRKLQTEVDP